MKKRLLRFFGVVTLPAVILQTSGVGFVLSTAPAYAAELTEKQATADLGTGAADEDVSTALAVDEVPAIAVDPVPAPNPILPNSCGLDMGLVIDSSGSIDATELTSMKNAFKGFVDAFLPGTPTQMSVVEFDTNVVTPILGFTNNVTSIKNRIDASVSGDFTNWEDPIEASGSLFPNRAAKPDLMVFASDGNPNTVGIIPPSSGGSATETAAVNAAIIRANTVKAAGVRVLALGIGNDLNVENLKKISGTNVNTGVSSDVITTSFDSLAADLAKLADDLCGGKILVQKQFDTNGDGTPEYDGTNPNALLAGWDFDVNGSPSNPAPQTTTATGSLEFSVLNGTYSVTETAVKPNTALASAVCWKGNNQVGTLNLATRTISGISLTTDETVSCYFINKATNGTLRVVKHVDGSNDPASNWQIHVLQNNVDVAGSPQAGSETGTDYILTAGPYTITETGPAGYTLTYSASCPNGAVTVQVGQSTTCTLTNTRDTGSVMVHKKVDADGNGSFEGSDAAANTIGFRWGLDAEVAARNMGTSATLVPTGAHTVTENSITNFHFVGWYPSSSTQYSCANPQGTTLPVSVTVTKNQASDITLCNARDTAPLMVKKAVDTDGDGDVDIADANNWTWDLDGGNQNFATGTAQTVTTGNHAVNEDNQAGYHNISWSCWNTVTAQALGNGVGTQLSVTVPLDGATCLFTNARDTGTITVHKHFDDNGDGQSDRSNPQGWTWDLVGGAQNNAGGTTLTLTTNAYTVTEDAITNYASTWVCSNQTSGTGTSFPVNLVANGQNIVCTFTNTRHTGSVVVHKFVDADGNGSFEGSDAAANALGFDWGIDAVAPARDMGTTANGILTGAHTVTESLVAGYHLVGWYPSNSTQYSCANPQGTSLPVAITVANGETAGVTFCNVLDVTTIDLQKTAPANVNAGDPIAYSITWSVSGNTAATNAVITDTLPANTSYLSANCGTTAGFCVIDDSTNTIVWYLGVRNPGETGSVTLNVVTNSPLPNGTVITNAATFDTDQTGPKTDDAKTTIVSAPTINFDKVGPSTVNAGDDITYTLYWSIGGNAPATNVVISDGIPALTTYVPASANCGGTAGFCVVDDNTSTLSWNLGTRNPGDSGSVAFMVTTDSPLYDDTLISNTGTLDTAENDPLSDTVYTWVMSDFAVHIEKSGPAFVNAGSDMTYTLNWVTAGNSPIDMLTITDPLPANTTFVSANNGGVYDNGFNTVTWDLGAHTPGDAGQVQVTVHVVSPLINGTTIANTATLCGFAQGGNDKDALGGDIQHCDDDKTTTTVTSSPIITVVKSDTPDPVQAGGQVVYTLAWTVTGNAPVTNLTLTDVLPINTTFAAADNGGVHNGATPGTVTWNLGNHVPGDAGLVTVTVNVVSPLANGTILTNLATIDSNENDPVSDTETTTVVSTATLTLTKHDNVDPVTPGGTVIYTLAWTVTGNSPVTNLVLTDALPTDLSFVSASNGGVHAGTTPGGTVTWNLGNHVPGDAGLVTVTVTTNSALSNGAVITNPASIDADETLPANASETTTITAAPILTISKTVNLPFANPGDTATYTVTVTNTGNDKAINVVVTDTLPAGFTFVDGGGNTKSFPLGNLEKGKSITFSYNVHIDTTIAAGVYENLAVARADNHGPVSAKVALDVRFPIVEGEQTPELTLEKRVEQKTANPGDEITYVLTIANTGNGIAEDVRLNDTLPNDFTFSDTGSTKRVWMIGTLLAGEVRTITYQVTISDSVKAGKHQNVVIATAKGLDPLEARANIDVIVPVVKGALTNTGASPRDYGIFLLGAALVCISALGLRKTRSFPA